MAKLIAYPGFAEGVVAELKVLTGDPWEVMDHKFESIAAHDALVNVHGSAPLSRKLQKDL